MHAACTYPIAFRNIRYNISKLKSILDLAGPCIRLNMLHTCVCMYSLFRNQDNTGTHVHTVSYSTYTEHPQRPSVHLHAHRHKDR